MSGQWHADPLGRADHRYYDGNAWTRIVANRGVQSEEDPSLPLTMAVAQTVVATATPTYAAPSVAVPAGYVIRPAGGGKLIAAGILSIISGGVTLLVGMAMKSVFDTIAGVGHAVCNTPSRYGYDGSSVSDSCNNGANSVSSTGTLIFIVVLLLGVAFLAAGIGAVMKKQWGQIATVVVGAVWTLFSLFLLIKSGEASVLVMVIWCGLIAGLAFFENRRVFDKYLNRTA